MAEPKYQIRKIAVAQKLSAIGRIGKTDNPGGENSPLKAHRKNRFAGGAGNIPRSAFPWFESYQAASASL
jgi:hypothetical protein